MAADACAGLQQSGSERAENTTWQLTAFRHINVRWMDPGWGEQKMTLADSTAQQTYNKLSVNRKNTNTATAVHQECCAPRSTDMHSHSSCSHRCTKVPEASFLGLSVKPYIHTADGEKEEEKQRWIIIVGQHAEERAWSDMPSSPPLSKINPCSFSIPSKFTSKADLRILKEVP